MGGKRSTTKIKADNKKKNNNLKQNKRNQNAKIKEDKKVVKLTEVVSAAEDVNILASQVIANDTVVFSTDANRNLSESDSGISSTSPISSKAASYIDLSYDCDAELRKILRSESSKIEIVSKFNNAIVDTEMEFINPSLSSDDQSDEFLKARNKSFCWCNKFLDRQSCRNLETKSDKRCEIYPDNYRWDKLLLEKFMYNDLIEHDHEKLETTVIKHGKIVNNPYAEFTSSLPADNFSPNVVMENALFIGNIPIEFGVDAIWSMVSS